VGAAIRWLDSWLYHVIRVPSLAARQALSTPRGASNEQYASQAGSTQILLVNRSQLVLSLSQLCDRQTWQPFLPDKPGQNRPCRFFFNQGAAASSTYQVPAGLHNRPFFSSPLFPV